MKKYFETTLKYTSNDEEGKTKRISRSFLVNAYSFTEAEKRTIQEEGEGLRDVAVTNVKNSRVTEVVGEASSGKHWYKLRVVYKEENEKGKIKSRSEYPLVWGLDIQDACNKMDKILLGTTLDAEIASCSVTKIESIIRFKSDLGVDTTIESRSENE